MSASGKCSGSGFVWCLLEVLHIHSHLSSAVEVTLYGACPLEVSGSTQLWRTSPSTASMQVSGWGCSVGDGFIRMHILYMQECTKKEIICI